MNSFCSNKNVIPLPNIVFKLKEAYCTWILIFQHIPQHLRFSFGKRIDETFLDCFELVSNALYVSPKNKLPLINKTIHKIDTLKILLQIGWESKIIKTSNLTKLIDNIEEIGKILYGWKRNIEIKLSA